VHHVGSFVWSVLICTLDVASHQFQGLPSLTPTPSFENY